MAIPD